LKNADLEEEDYWGIAQFDTIEEEKPSVYAFLWISEKLLL
jgi:hypothetical protein